MAWYNFWKSDTPEAVIDDRPLDEYEEKLNPIQRYFKGIQGSTSNSEEYAFYYEELEIVNRAINMVVDDVAEIPVKVGNSTKAVGVVTGIRANKLNTLLNIQPNLFQDINTFKRNLATDFLLDGNIFIYYDGAHLYHLPASNVQIHEDDQTFVEKYTYNEIEYSPSEIIHIKENSFKSIYRGVSRLEPALRSMQLITSMRTFQDNFFENGAVPGLVLKSPNTLSEKIKERMIRSWTSKYNPKSGGRKPLILDGGLEVADLTKVNFRDLDFQKSIEDNGVAILKAIGIPPVLMDGGNNANIKPNMRLYYLETVLPIVRKINFALERYFGFAVTEDATYIPALQPELKELSAYHTSLVNGGVISPNEARVALGMEPITDQDMDTIRIPANIAGSAADPSQGGKPKEEEDTSE